MPSENVSRTSRLNAATLKTATLYVTLEPCSTQGRTPPCTDLILEKGDWAGCRISYDLNPKHAGRGLEILESAGVEVVSGVCETEGRELIAPFEKFITTGMPYVTLKLASTLDGRIADCTGDSKWITGAEARECVQAMRRRADAVMVGAATVRADDPSLLPRPAEGRSPMARGDRKRYSGRCESADRRSVDLIGGRAATGRMVRPNGFAER